MILKVTGQEFELPENPYSFIAFLQSNCQNLEHWVLGKSFAYANIPKMENDEQMISYLTETKDALIKLVDYVNNNELYYDSETLDNFVSHSHVVNRLSGFKKYVDESLKNREEIETAAASSYQQLLKEVLDLSVDLNSKIDIRIKRKDYYSREKLWNFWSDVLSPFLKDD